MAFIRRQGKTKIMYFGSTSGSNGVVAAGAVVALSSGRIIPSTDATSPSTNVGVIRETITSSSTAYATAGTPVAVEVPVEMNVVWEAEVDDTAVLTDTDQGQYMDMSTDADGLSVDTSQSDTDAVFCTGFISTVLGEFILNMGATYYDAS